MKTQPRGPFRTSELRDAHLCAVRSRDRPNTRSLTREHAAEHELVHRAESGFDFVAR